MTFNTGSAYALEVRLPQLCMIKTHELADVINAWEVRATISIVLTISLPPRNAVPALQGFAGWSSHRGGNGTEEECEKEVCTLFFQQKFNFFVTDLLMVVSDAIVGIVGWTIGGHTTCCVQNLRSCGYFAGNLGLELIGIMRKNRGSTEKEEVIIISSPRISETLAPVSSVLGERRPVLLLHCHKDLIFTACIHHRLSWIWKR